MFYVYYVLTTIEEYQKDIGSLLLQMVNKETILTLEHIMPQTKNEEWRKVTGEKYDQIHENFLNNIGNLTLTAYNSKYSNKSFKFKQECENGFNQSQLNINKLVKEAKVWTEREIIDRQKFLIAQFLKCFPTPQTTIPLTKTKRLKLNEINEDALTKTKISEIIIETENETKEMICKNWKEAVREISNFCYNIDNELFNELCDDDELKKTYKFLGREKSFTKYTINDFVPNKNIWFNDCLNANLIFKFIKILCKKYGIDEDVFIEFEKI